jgi:flagellar hook assembly protein FlgD
VKISLIDILGNTVRIFKDEKFTEGNHTLYWKTKDQNNRKLKNGIYILKIKVKNNQKSIKILVQ